jgi:CTP-dependent riboflavin kinase
VAKQRKIVGVVFSDLGQGASFMALDWVRQALEESLGFVPYPATLNVRPKDPRDARMWEKVQEEIRGVPMAPREDGFCSARLFPVAIQPQLNAGRARTRAAVLLPEVAGYPKDKIEIVAPVRLKDEFGVRDGDQLTLEFIH